jgi:hypothetical protein
VLSLFEIRHVLRHHYYFIARGWNLEDGKIVERRGESSKV